LEFDNRKDVIYVADAQPVANIRGTCHVILVERARRASAVCLAAQR